MAVTSKGIWTPDNSDQYDLIVDAAATANSIDQAISKTATSLAGLGTGAYAGQWGWVTGGGGVPYQWNGSSWVPSRALVETYIPTVAEYHNGWGRSSSTLRFTNLGTHCVLTGSVISPSTVSSTGIQILAPGANPWPPPYPMIVSLNAYTTDASIGSAYRVANINSNGQLSGINSAGPTLAMAINAVWPI